MKDYSEYFTPEKIATYLVEFIPFEVNYDVIDICCGGCNLLKAASYKRKDMTFYGVDINLTHIDQKFSCNYIKRDGREYAIDAHRITKKYDVVLANPPFENDFVDSKLTELIEADHDYSRVINKGNLLVEMVLANMLLVKENGILLAILPSSVIEGERYVELRKIISKRFRIEKMIKLPNKIFNDNEIYTYGIVMAKVEDSGYEVPVECLSIDNDVFSLSTEYVIESNSLKNGNWFKYDHFISKKIFEFDIFRGNISTDMFAETGIEVLHLAKKKNDHIWVPRKRFFRRDEKRNYKKATSGDVIVSRVGRDSGEIYPYKGNDAYVSDCLIVLRGIEYDVLIQYLYDYHSANSFRFLRKGTTSKYISANDLRRLFRVNG